MNLTTYLNFLLNLISPYFNKPYRDNPADGHVERIIGEHKYVVHRMNHGVIHGIRQGLLSLDIINILSGSSVNDQLTVWIDKKLTYDPKFKYKVMFAAVFQRSGRESEIDSLHHPKIYKQYENADVKNFQENAKKYIGSLFKNNDEILLYGNAIRWPRTSDDTNEKNNSDLLFLRKILHASHLLDLRRIPHFDSVRIKKETNEKLFDNSTNQDFMKIIDILFDYSGMYLTITGDRDMIGNRMELHDNFFILSNNMKLLSCILNKYRNILFKHPKNIIHDDL